MNDEMYEKIKILQRIISFRFCDFPQIAKQLYSNLESHLQSSLATECKHCFNEIKELQEKNKRNWDVLFSDLSRRVIEFSISSEKTDINFSEYVSEYLSTLQACNEKILLEKLILLRLQEKNSEFQQRLQEIIQKFREEYSKLSTSLQEEVKKLSKEIIECFESPFYGADNDIYVTEPKIKISEYEDTEFLGYEEFELKDKNNAVVFDGTYPVVANRNNLIVISYCSNENPTSSNDVVTNNQSYATVSNILSNICFQELCRNIGQNRGKSFHVHVWKSERDNQIDIGKSFEIIERVSRYIPNTNAEKMLQIYSDKYDELKKLTEIWAQRLSSDQNPFELVVVLYNMEAGKKGLRDAIVKLAKLRKSNIFTVCICRSNEVNDLNEAVPNHDNVHLLEPQKNTILFNTDYIPLGDGGIVKKEKFSNITSLNFLPVLPYFTNNLDFKYYSLRMMISPPPKLSTGAIKIPVGTINAFPYFWYYQSSGTANNAYISGRSGSGKTYLLKDILTYLAQNYTPEEVNVYFCCLADKGKEDMGPLCNVIPHITLSVISTKPTFVQILINKLEMEYLERSRKFSAMANILKQKYNIEVSIDIDKYHFYCKKFPGEFEPLPMIFVIIDEIDVFIKASDAFRDLFRKFCSLLRIIRTSGIFTILANQDFNSVDVTSQLLVYHLSLYAPDNQDEIFRTVTRLEDKTSFALDSIIKNTSKNEEERNAELQENLRQLKLLMVEKYGKRQISRNYFGFSCSNSYSCFPGLKETPIIKDLFSAAIKQSTKNSLNIFAGISFGRTGDKSLETCFMDPFFFTLAKSANLANVGNHFLIINEFGEVNTAFWTQAIYSILAQNATRCSVSFLDFSLSTEEKAELCNFSSPSSSIFFPTNIGDLSQTIDDWEKHAKSGCHEGYDFNILIINIDSAKTLFEEDFLKEDFYEKQIEEKKSPVHSKTEEIKAFLAENHELSGCVDIDVDFEYIEEGATHAVPLNNTESPSKIEEIRSSLAGNPELTNIVDTDIQFEFIDAVEDKNRENISSPPSCHHIIKNFDELKEKLYQMREQMRWARSRGAYIFLQIGQDFNDLLHRKGAGEFIKSFDSCIAFKVKQRIESYAYLNVTADEINEVGYYIPHPARIKGNTTIDACAKSSYERIIPVSPEAIKTIVKEMDCHE